MYFTCRLIEEFMLLANMTVAEHIYNVFPKLAFLRQHLPPRGNMMVELKKRYNTYFNYFIYFPDFQEIKLWGKLKVMFLSGLRIPLFNILS